MGIVGSPILSEGGGGVSDIKDAYTVANAGVTITNADSPFTVTDTGSVVVYVDSSGGAVTINPNSSPATDDRIKIVDVGGDAGTNNITITGLGIIAQDLGSQEHRYSGSAWQLLEASGGVDIVGSATTPDLLESGYPAAANGGKWGLVGSTDASDEDGLYLSNGSTWVKKLNDSDFVIGNRSNLFNFDPTEIGYLATDFLSSGESGVLINSATSNPTYAFDNLTTTAVKVADSTASAGINLGAGEHIGKTFLGDGQEIGKIVVRSRVESLNGTYPAIGMESFRLEGLHDQASDWQNISISSINVTLKESHFGTVTHDGTDVTTPFSGGPEDGSEFDVEVEVQFSETLLYGYRLVVTKTQNDVNVDHTQNKYGIVSLEAYQTSGVANPDSTIEDGLNRLHAGVSKGTNGTAITADTPLDDFDYIIEVDSSGGIFTQTLPAVGDVKTGKRYLFKKVGTGTNAVTLDGDGAETIDGAVTNATALVNQYDSIEVYNNGTEWLIIG